ncbi:hypothetical protein B0H17DRAFT_716658 [Mycena rosella]|uniref:Uncharacterized protein n=1 Tax=Mycena rosella TaxID=1033263 RepID=A0AAD7DA05_MYCRO|nr:hypothetical protein B0H17DRAFT_716658 [Mycena rosella]
MQYRSAWTVAQQCTYMNVGSRQPYPSVYMRRRTIIPVAAPAPSPASNGRHCSSAGRGARGRCAALAYTTHMDSDAREGPQGGGALLNVCNADAEGCPNVDSGVWSGMWLRAEVATGDKWRDHGQRVELEEGLFPGTKRSRARVDGLTSVADRVTAASLLSTSSNADWCWVGALCGDAGKLMPSLDLPGYGRVDGVGAKEAADVTRMRLITPRNSEARPTGLNAPRQNGGVRRGRNM